MNEIISKYKNCCALTFSIENLDCHHLVSWHLDKEKRTCSKNGVLLSKQVHKDFHQKYGYLNNTEKQFAEYCTIFFSIDGFEYKKSFDRKKPTNKK